MDKIAILKVNPDHPAKCYRIGRYLVGASFAPYALNDSEWKELDSDGCKRWLIVQNTEQKVVKEPIKSMPTQAAPIATEKKKPGRPKGWTKSGKENQAGAF